MYVVRFEEELLGPKANLQETFDRFETFAEAAAAVEAWISRDIGLRSALVWKE